MRTNRRARFTRRRRAGSGYLAGDAEASGQSATQLRWAFENVGFYYLVGHGVPQSLGAALGR
jgi:hypothetical protein